MSERAQQGESAAESTRILTMKAKKLPIFQSPDARRVLNDACARHGVTLKLLQELIDVQRDYMGSGRREGITTDLDATLGEYIDVNGDH